MTTKEPKQAKDEPQQSNQTYIPGMKGVFWFFVIMLLGPIIGWMFGVIEYLVLIYMGLTAGAVLLNLLD